MRAVISLAAMLSASAVHLGAAEASTLAYSGRCVDQSYSKQGEQDADLTSEAGKAITCDFATISQFDNGRKFVQIATKRGRLSPLGFAGSTLDTSSNPRLTIMPIDRIYLPVPLPGKSETVDGVEGFCFFQGHNLLKSDSLSCTAKIDIGTQKLIYRINFRITDVDLVPGP